MKTMRFALCCLLVATAVCRAQPITDPSWFRSGPGPEIPEEAGAMPSGEADLPAPPAYDPKGLGQGQDIAEAITPEIQALARGLQNDPLAIYNYVRTYIRYVHYFGSKKGAQLTLLEKKGNDFDQCALLVALLRAAGYTPSYQFGIMAIPWEVQAPGWDAFRPWLCLNLYNTNWGYTSNYFVNLSFNKRGFPGPGTRDHSHISE